VGAHNASHELRIEIIYMFFIIPTKENPSDGITILGFSKLILLL
jgi:hypothetical protein